MPDWKRFFPASVTETRPHQGKVLRVRSIKVQQFPTGTRKTWLCGNWVFATKSFDTDFPDKAEPLQITEVNFGIPHFIAEVRRAEKLEAWKEKEERDCESDWNLVLDSDLFLIFRFDFWSSRWNHSDASMKWKKALVELKKMKLRNKK